MSSEVPIQYKPLVESQVEGRDIKLDMLSNFYTENKNDIYSKWNDNGRTDLEKKLNSSIKSQLDKAYSTAAILKSSLNDSPDEFEGDGIQIDGKIIKSKKEVLDRMMNLINSVETKLIESVGEVSDGLRYELYKDIRGFLIYTLNTQALRGIVSESKKQPLGINGEGLDILLANFDEAESERIQQYNYLISWIDELVLDEKDVLKYKGHKLGRSTSILYFKDKFMRKNNNVFSAENANERALHILFYLALFISKKTPQLFAIDNIETALNPRVCRTLVKELAQLAKENNKQALITTHNPAILDGLNLNDDEQRLFVVYRTDEGHTKTKRIKLKPETKEGNLKLSELWMRGHLGGLPNDF